MSSAQPTRTVRHFERRRSQRAGTLYVAVLGVSMIVALIGLATLHLSRVEIDVLSGAEQAAQAELLAQSAVEFALARTALDTNWRSNFASGVENPSGSWLSLGGGSFRYALVDADGDLDDNANDAVTIRGIGRYGEATQVTTITAQPSASALDCLTVALHAGDDLNCNGPSLTCNQMISSNDDINSSGGGSISSHAWAVDSISGNVIGNQYEDQWPARQMPDSTSVWDYYLANGTRIDVDSIPANRIEDVVVSAGNNPYGAENLQGIYIVDCHGEGLTIADCRINATLVVVNPGSTVVLDDALTWEPPALHFPALMVQGNLNMAWNGTGVVQESAVGVNLNPAGSPYADVTDADQTDNYPSVISGLVYVSGNLQVTSACTLDGVTVVGGTATFTANLTLTYSSAHAVLPPPGFSGGSVLRVIPRTWQRTVR
jgi:hypothetical protein